MRDANQGAVWIRVQRAREQVRRQMTSYNGFHTLMQKVASSAIGAWCFSKMQRPIDVLILKLTGKFTATSFLSGLPLVVLEVRGAKSGKLRVVPLLCIGADGRGEEFAVIASNWGQARFPAWYHNLKAHPQTSGTIAGRQRSYLGEEIHGERYDRYWQQAQETYLGFAKYHNRISGKRHIPIIVLRAE